VAIGLLGGAGFYIYQGLSRNSQASEKLNEIYNTLKTLQSQSPAPGNEKINNTTIAKEQEQDVQKWIAGARNYFQPIPAIPPKNVTSEAFASALRRTVDLLQRAADGASVTLPPKYDFSFSAQRPLVKFAAGSLEPLATQLGEVKAIAEVIFSTRINALDSLQRIRVSEDDLQGPQGDYLDAHAVTNDLAVLTPYVVTFRCFTPELARVITAFAVSSNAFLIKSINVLPAGSTAGFGQPGDPAMGGPGGYPPGMPGRFIPGEGGFQPPQAQAPATQPATGKGGLPTVIKEQLLRITMEVEVVKLLPKK
jgi:hypothetical protein